MPSNKNQQCYYLLRIIRSYRCCRCTRLLVLGLLESLHIYYLVTQYKSGKENKGRHIEWASKHRNSPIVSANDSTLLRYSKKTRCSGIIRGQISRRIVGYNLTQVIIDLELTNLAFTICASSLADL